MGTDSKILNEYNFIYQTQQVPISYTVRYLEAETMKELIPPKYAESYRPLVYEDFIVVPGYVPDAYSKKLYISALPDSNIITFWYTKDTSHARFRKTYWIQTVNGQGGSEEFPGYEIYSTETALLGDLGVEFQIESMSIPGFKEIPNLSGTSTTGILTENGLHLMRFYNRISYPYEIRYLEYGTNHSISEGNNFVLSAVGTAPYEDIINCVPKKIDGWICKNPEPYEMKIAIENDPTKPAQNNVFTFFYTKVKKTCNLTIRKSGCDQLDNNQSFLFHILQIQSFADVENPADITVSVKENNSVTIKGLSPGRYTVKELTDWSWRYTPEQDIYMIELTDDYVLNIINTCTYNKWLNSMAWLPNQFTIKKKEDENAESGG